MPEIYARDFFFGAKISGMGYARDNFMPEIYAREKKNLGHRKKP